MPRTFPASSSAIPALRSIFAMRTGLPIPRLGSLRARALPILLVCAAFLMVLCTAPRTCRAVGWFGGDSVAETGGTPQWWKKHKKNAVFVEGQGYRVEGYDGYFDGLGRPISAPVDPATVSALGEEKSDVGLLPGLDPHVQYNKMKAAVGLGPNEQYARQAYVEGDREFREKSYKAAAEHFQTAVTRGPHSAIEEDAMFMLAESYFFGDQYIKARDAYDALVKEYSNTRYLDTVIDREWKIARYWEEKDLEYHHWKLTPNLIDKTRPWFDTRGHAIKAFESIRLNDPTGPRADDAILATANIHFRYREFEDADYNYGLLRREYPRSELQFEAHLLGLQAKLRKYQGEDYDGTPLEEAKMLVKQLNSQFSGRLSNEEKDRLVTVEGQLNQEIATRDYRMAAYYDKKKDYGAAKFYYAQVIKKYPDTELATKSRERAGEIKEEPDRPPKRLAFLVGLFPESSERTRVARIPELQKGGTRLAEAPANGESTNAPATTTK
jgi:outer membrane protein assembly factor BamD (BamD/ComL family)